MNRRRVEVTSFGHTLEVKCFDVLNANPISCWTTDNYLAVGVIAQIWIERGTSEEEMEKILDTII
jgi:hypothetical protein